MISSIMYCRNYNALPIKCQKFDTYRKYYSLFATVGVLCPEQIEIDCGKSRQTAATPSTADYRFTTVRETESYICTSVALERGYFIPLHASVRSGDQRLKPLQ